MIFSPEKSLHPARLSDALVPRVPHPSSNWAPSFGLFKPNQHLLWVALNKVGFWCLCLAIYLFFEGKGSSAHCPSVW